MTTSVSAIAQFLGVEFVGRDLIIEAPSSTKGAIAGSVCFALSASRIEEVLPDKAAIICSSSIANFSGNKTFIFSEAARRDFARVLDEFFPLTPRAAGIHSTAIVDRSAAVDPTASISPFCVIGARCEIGPRTMLHSHVVLGDGTRIGSDCSVGPHTSIGGAGFGFEKDVDGNPFRLSHRGGVVINDFVQIGALVSIAQGTLDPTRIGSHSMIDDHVFLAHNVQVGERVFIIAGSEVSGSVTIGADAWIAPQATIRNGVRIGERAVVGIGSVVVKDVEEGATVLGNPARPRE